MASEKARKTTNRSIFRVVEADQTPDFGGREPGPSEPHTLFSPPISDEGKWQSEREPETAIFSLPIVSDPWRCQLEDTVNYPIEAGTVIARKYKIIEHLGSGTFSHAVHCREKLTGKSVCVKIVRNNKDFLDQALGEVKILQYLNRMDPNGSQSLLRLFEFFYYKEHLFVVTELLRDNLYVLYRYNASYFTLPRIRSMARQLLQAVGFLHRHSVYHCDLKPENILLSSFSRCQVKIIDFGNSCFNCEAHSSYVQSRCYRAPEVLLGAPYNHKIDVWSLGCIFAELFAGGVLFKHDTLQALLASIMAIIGPIPAWLLEQGAHTASYFTATGQLFASLQRHDSDAFYFAYLVPEPLTLSERLNCRDVKFLSALTQLLQLDHRRRPSCEEALTLDWLREDQSGECDDKSADQQNSVWPELHSHPKATPAAQRRGVPTGSLPFPMFAATSTGAGPTSPAHATVPAPKSSSAADAGAVGDTLEIPAAPALLPASALPSGYGGFSLTLDRSHILATDGGSLNGSECASSPNLHSPMPPCPPKLAASGSPKLAASGSPKLAASGSPKLAASGSPNLAASGSPKLAASVSPKLAASGSPKLAASGCDIARGSALSSTPISGPIGSECPAPQLLSLEPGRLTSSMLEPTKIGLSRSCESLPAGSPARMLSPQPADRENEPETVASADHDADEDVGRRRQSGEEPRDEAMVAPRPEGTRPDSPERPGPETSRSFRERIAKERQLSFNKKMFGDKAERDDEVSSVLGAPELRCSTRSEDSSTDSPIEVDPGTNRLWTKRASASNTSRSNSTRSSRSASQNASQNVSRRDSARLSRGTLDSISPASTTSPLAPKKVPSLLNMRDESRDSSPQLI